MAGRGPRPNRERRRASAPARGEFVTAVGVGWQHGDVPAPPARLLKASQEAWATWFGGWFAAFWTPDDLPALRQVIRLYDQVERGQFQRAAELRLQMDGYGITPKGQVDRRWKPPDAPSTGDTPTQTSRYGHLRPVGDNEGEPA